VKEAQEDFDERMEGAAGETMEGAGIAPPEAKQ